MIHHVFTGQILIENTVFKCKTETHPPPRSKFGNGIQRCPGVITVLLPVHVRSGGCVFKSNFQYSKLMQEVFWLGDYLHFNMLYISITAGKLCLTSLCLRELFPGWFGETKCPSIKSNLDTLRRPAVSHCL